MFDFIKPYNNDASIGLLSTPITTSAATRTFLLNLPLYRKGLSSLLRGLEIGMAHGYFLIGPFVELGPLRNSSYALLFGFLATIGLIVILTLALYLYGSVIYQDELKTKKLTRIISSKKEWNQFTSGFFIGSSGGASFVYLLLQIFKT
jgi:photosystem I subunit 11